jgi:AAA+ superfamily predicted ATPase
VEALSLSNNAISYHVSQALAGIYPKKAILEGQDSSFDIEKYAKANLCTIQALVKSDVNYPSIGFSDSFSEMSVTNDISVHNQITNNWDGMVNEIYKYTENAILEVTWQGHKLDILLMSWLEGTCKIRYYWVLADNQEVTENFFANVCKWNSEIRDEVLVFEDGYWNKNPELFKSIQGAIFDNLILHGSLKKDIQEDLINFFASRETYTSYNVPWKRGILFIGSPGNGKTHTVKALINQIQKPCLYVKSFQSEYDTDSENIRKVFKQARQSAPCILVLEDIDSLLTDENRSFFLNELDGFASNEGIVTIATTNHPERLDTAISDRPSRFDRKYHFQLPDITERKAYIALWNSKLKSDMHIPETGINKVVTLTDGFSFAYLKELFLSSMIRWIGGTENGEMEKIMISQVAVLREQMTEAIAS